MSRARNLKPGFFKNDVLAECPPLTRILFQGLWCEADRDGRLEDRPKRLKAEILPYDEIDIDAALDLLHEKGFILRYQKGGNQYIQVLAFKKHQNPHVKESASSIPVPDSHGASTVQAQCKPENGEEENSSSPADSLLLIPDSIEQQQGAPPDGEAPPKTDPPTGELLASESAKVSAITEAIPFLAIVEAYNRTMEKLAKVREVTAARKTAIRAAWQASKNRRSLEFWAAYFEECGDDAFLNGTGPYTNGHENWRPDFDYLMKPKVITRTYERALDRMERTERTERTA